jgi:hypothetical protein
MTTNTKPATAGESSRCAHPPKAHTDALSRIDPLAPEDLNGLSRNDLQILATTAFTLRNYRGVTTPADRFIYFLLVQNSMKPLTPEDVKATVEEFEEEFTGALEAAGHMLHCYPELLREKVQSAYGLKLIKVPAEG